MKQLEYRIEKRISKTNKEYTVLILKLTSTYEKVIFLDSAEVELLKIISK